MRGPVRANKHDGHFSRCRRTVAGRKSNSLHGVYSCPCVAPWPLRAVTYPHVSRYGAGFTSGLYFHATVLSSHAVSTRGEEIDSRWPASEDQRGSATSCKPWLRDDRIHNTHQDFASFVPRTNVIPTPIDPSRFLYRCPASFRAEKVSFVHPRLLQRCWW